MGTKFAVTLFFIASGLCFLFTVASSPPIVNIKNGTIEGTEITTDSGRNIFSFQGIPYALPPIGKLRFEVPQPANAWTNVLIANKDAEVCIQRDFILSRDIIGSENCLYLNVYTPKLPNSQNQDVDEKYPVMFWIHGGAFIQGSSDSNIYGPGYLLDYNTVLVTINYRLGPMGFLSTEDTILPGNLGMKDQVQALRWVNENIDKFGGDPNCVTIFGESAGGVSTHYHMISPLSKGLFHRAISQSGTIHSSWTLYRPGSAKKHAKRLGEMMNCPTNNSVEFVDCMRNIDAKNIIETDDNFKVLGIDPLITFKLSIEPDHSGAFLTKEPTELIEKGQINDVPWLTGLNSHEGSLRVMTLFSNDERDSLTKLNEKWTKYAPVSLTIDDSCPENLQDKVTNKIRKFYFGDEDITRSTKTELINMYSDAWFNVGTCESVKTHYKKFSSPVYFYHFAYRGRYSVSNVYDIFGEYGVSHADELQYLFSFNIRFFFDLIKLPVATEDLNVAHFMTNLWYNFAKTGNPTPEITEKIPVKWLPVQSEELEYFDIKSSTSFEMLKNFQSDRIAFWNSIPHRANIVPFLNDAKDEL